MSKFINQHSYALVGAAVLGIAYVVFSRISGSLRWLAMAATLAVVVAAAVVLRTPAGDVGSTTELDRLLARGRPVALEFFSNY